MLKFFLVAHLTYENHWGKLHSKIRTFGFFGTPYCLFIERDDKKLQIQDVPAIGDLACAPWFQQHSISIFLGHPVVQKVSMSPCTVGS